METAPHPNPETAPQDGREPRVAVLLPCFNEEAAIADTVQAFRAVLPDARIYVFDNASTDATADRARDAGAVVRRENNRGKGNVVRRMFADLDADIYIMADGDGTYDADSVHVLMAPVLAGEADMAVGARAAEAGAHRPGHAFGNRLFNKAVGWLFGKGFSDIFSGYRVFNRRFVKSFPALSTGFEIETELTIHALELRMPVAEFPLPFRQRPAGSASKLKTVQDGLRISRTILLLFAGSKPFACFGSIAGFLAAAAVIIAFPLLPTYLETGLVPRFPTAILSTGLMITALLSFTCGVILDSVARGRREAKRLAYLAIKPFARW